MRLTRDQLVRLAFLGIAVIAAFLLISGVPRIELAPGLPFSSIWAFLIGDFAGVPRGPTPSISSPFGEALLDMLRIFFVIALIAFPFGVILTLIDSEARKRLFRALLRTALFVALLALFMQSQVDEPPTQEDQPLTEMEPGQDLGPVVPLTDEEFDPQSVPPWVVWGASLALGLLLAFTIIVVVNQIRKSREEEAPLTEIARRARRAIDDIQGGGDLRNTILRCYAEMSRVVREERGVRRDRDVTAREFTEFLIGAQLPPQPVMRLTRLFEKARYSGATPTSRDEQEAIASLQAIVDACGVAQ